jgi:hypothetical protein
MSSYSVNPVMRLQYQLEPNMSIEAEMNINATYTSSGTDLYREMIFLGYRWNL